MSSVVISATGLYTPEQSISNDELVESYNRYVEQYNHDNAESIDKAEVVELTISNSAFIEKASGIKSRFVLAKERILDPNIMSPDFSPRDDSEMSLMCEMAVVAAKQALTEAKLDASEIDLVIVAASNMERAYPAIAIEVQAALGCSGYAFDMNVACSSATFGIKTAYDALIAGTNKKVLMVNPEICSGHLNFRNRDCHFVFGDVCTAVNLETKEASLQRGITNGFEIKEFKLITQYSNNIRNNFGFLNRAAKNSQDLLFKQEGRKVFKEVVPMVIKLITETVEQAGKTLDAIKTYWLHQANINMNMMIAKKLIGQPPTLKQAPTVLDTYANTSSAGSVIAFHLHKNEIEQGEFGVLCSFGAGYSAGAVVLEKIS
ncbi:MAG: beta-ketoacyl-ACP synthase III [Kangiellaceae bacterium]|nr:beta-ketoacyl-ACP synthase III [Kangiellaceae bacterium]